MVKGYTLLEILVVISLIIVTLCIAVPGWSEWANTNAAATQINQLVSIINLARSTAIKHNTIVSICPSSDGNACSGSWNDGYLIFVNPQRLNQISAKENRVRFYKPASHNGHIYWNGKDIPSANALGAMHNGTFSYCPKNNDVRFARELIISSTGRIRISKQVSLFCH